MRRKVKDASKAPVAIVRLTKSPKQEKKWRVVIEDPEGRGGGGRSKTVDFGQRGASDFTKHKDCLRMTKYLVRHGGRFGREMERLISVGTEERERTGRVSKEICAKIVREGLDVDEMRGSKSVKERWGGDGTDEERVRLAIRKAGFWSRWLLWSHPTLKEAKREIEDRFGVRIV